MVARLRKTRENNMSCYSQVDKKSKTIKKIKENVTYRF